MNYKFVSLSIVVVGLILLGFQNCGEYKLTKTQAVLSIDPKASFCTSPSDAVQSNLKFMFVVDRSGSNQQNFIILPDGTVDFGNPQPGTDPDGNRRFQALVNFIQNYRSGDDQYTYWSMVEIADQGREVLPFTNDRDSFLNDINSQWTNTASLDGGGTNYIDTLDTVQQMIQADVAAARLADPQISSNYVVFYVSDGVPYVGGVLQSQGEVNLVIDSMLSFQEANRDLVEGIQMNTAYYYSNINDPNARAGLTEMATRGFGSFLEFGAGENIDFSRFAIPIRISRFDLKEFWVVNTNTIWEGNELRRDADADGLSDVLEAELGSDPSLYDSDGNGVGDGVEYRVSGKTAVCQNSDCSFPGTPGPCSMFLGGRTQAPWFEDRDSDYLNDCEERLLSSDFEEPDTNADYIPDHLAFISETNLTELSSATLLDPDNDGVSDYSELKQNTPLRVNNSSIEGLQTLKLNAQLMSQSADQDCYAYDIIDMGFFREDDTIRVYLMENSQSVAEKRVMRSSEKQLNNGGVRFTESDFN